ncbi:MAG: hypothetical protein HYZ92_01530, partial [Candidatus Omnitrophica bacterium]|nr:hypothetical protein [Candidatus Omnitrophota bacterium]
MERGPRPGARGPGAGGAPASQACTSTSFSASGDFSATQGSCGWSYRYQPLNSSTVYTMSWVPSNPDADFKNTWKGNEPYLLLWADGGHPGGAGHAIRRWTAPSAGTVQLVSNGTVRDLDPTCGDGVTVSIKTG